MTPGAPERPRKGDSQAVRVAQSATFKMLMAALIGAVVAVVSGQFVPLLTGNTASAINIAALESRMDENFGLVREDIKRLEDEIERSMQNHKEATAHGGALQLLISHGKQLTDHERRLDTLEEE